MASLAASVLAGATFAGSSAAQSPADPLARRAGVSYEQIAGRQVEYGSVRSARGQRVRTITSRPANASGRLPVIVFIPWLSCDSVESPRGPTDGWSRMLHGVASGVDAVFVRVDKPGVGDSEGDCSKTDLEDDLAAYRAAIRARWREATSMLRSSCSSEAALAVLSRRCSPKSSASMRS